MTTDESILQEMLDRATNPARENVDELAVQMFCMVVRSNLELVHKAQEMLVSKIRSNDVTESTRAIGLLEECMSKCGGEFQDEAAKFRFLNDLIRLVSKKYQGPETPPAIKQRIMECLLLWTTEFPQKAKIRDAYDMLQKEGGVEPGSTSSAMAKRETILGIDGDMFSKLVNSKDPENYKRANLLVQYRVQQDARRTELTAQHRCELEEVQETVGVLNAMLDTFKQDGCTSADSGDNMTLIRELYLLCKKHKPILQRLPELIENTNSELIADTLEANDMLQAVMERYKNTVVHPTKTTTTNATKTASSSLQSNTDLLELLGDIITTTPTTTTTKATVANGDTIAEKPAAVDQLTVNLTSSNTVNSTQHSLDELHAIFENAAKTEGTTPPAANNLLDTFDLLQPETIFPSSTKETENGSKSNKDDEVAASCKGFRQLRDIDQLSEQLFQANLQNNERLRSFKKDPEKITLNDLAKEKSNTEPTSLTPTTLTPKRSAKAAMQRLEKSLVQLTGKLLEDEDILTHTLPAEVSAVSAPTQPDVSDDVQMLSDTPDISETPVSLPANSKVLKDELPTLETTKQEASLPFKHLSEISIDLELVKPKPEPAPILTDDDDIKITLNFTEDRPSRHVSVIVISIWNKSSLPIKDIQFEASVKKPSKVRLLPPTDNTMPPFKPFRPPPPINQVMLLLNPTGKAVDVTCILGYRLGDDPDPIKDSIVAKDIPFVE